LNHRNRFELETLEQRILLSADPLLGALTAITAVDDPKLTSAAEQLLPTSLDILPAGADRNFKTTTDLSDCYDPADCLDDLFSGLMEVEPEALIPADSSTESDQPDSDPEILDAVHGEQTSFAGFSSTEISDKTSLCGNIENLDTRLATSVYDHFNDGLDPPGSTDFSDTIQFDAVADNHALHPAPDPAAVHSGGVFACADDHTLVYYALTGQNTLTLRVIEQHAELVDDTSGAVLAAAALSAIDRIDIRGQDGVDDLLRVDLSAPLLRDVTIAFEGGAGGYDSLVLLGNQASTIRYTAIGEDAGWIQISGPYATAVIQFAGLEPATDSAITVSSGGGHDTLTIGPQGGPVSFGENSIRIGDGPPIAYDADLEILTLSDFGQYRTEGGSNGSRATATELELIEDPVGSGYFTAHGLGSINPTSDRDFWRFEALAGDKISIAVDTLGSGLTPSIQLRNASYLLGTKNYTGPNNDAFYSTYSISSSGIYYVDVYSYNNRNTGSYQVRVDVARGVQLESDESYSNNGISGADALTLTGAGTDQVGTVAGTIMLPQSGQTDEDLFALGTLSAGNQVVLEVVLPSTSTLLPWVRLIDGSGTTVVDTDGDPLDGRFEGEIPADGAYYAKVESYWVYGGHRYLATAKTSWSAAEAYAQSLGGHLVTVDDAAEDQWLDQIRRPIGQVMLGLNDVAVEGTWVWADGTPVGYTAWAAGQPYSSGTYDYAYINTDGLWYNGYNNSTYIGLVEIADGAVPASAEPGPWGQYLLSVNIEDLVLPFVSATPGLPSDGVVAGTVVDSFRVRFSEDLSAATVNSADRFDLRAAGTDGEFDTADDQIYSLSISPEYSSGNDVRLFINNGPLKIGHYRFRVAGTITDRVDNFLDGNGDGTGGDAYRHLFEIALPAGHVLEGGDNGSLNKATKLEFVEEPFGRGYWTGRGLGSVNPASDHDFWSFEALAGDKVSIAVDTPESGLNPYLRLRDASNTQLRYDDNSGPDSDAYISAYTIPTSGIYYLDVHSYNNGSSGKYRLRVDMARGVQLESDENYSNDGISGADVLVMEPAGDHKKASVAGTLMANQSGNFDEDTFNLGAIQSGQTILARLILLEGSTLRPIIEIRDWNNQVRSVNPNPVDGSIARVDISEAGSYYATVVAFEGHGDYGQYLLDITIAPTSEFMFADLSVTEISSPESGDSGGSIQLSWSVGNFGTAYTETDTWYDSILLSPNGSFSDGDDIHIGSVQHSGTLAPNDIYSTIADIQLPRGISGPYWFAVTTDSANQVAEFDLEDNNLLPADTPVSITLTPYADFAATDIASDAIGAVGAPYTLTWQVTNAGTGTSGDGTPGGTVNEWVDRIVFSSNTVFGDGDDVWIADITHSGSLDPSASYSASWTGQLPAGLSGQYHVMVVADHDDGVYEYRELESNLYIKPDPVDVAASLFADLSASVPRAPPAGIVGKAFTVEWTVTNTSAAWSETPVSWWSDSVILSGDTTLGNEDDQLLGQFRHYGMLGINESYDGSGTVILPGGIEGTFYLFIAANSDNRVYEFVYDDNNVGGPLPIEIAGPDLVVDQIADVPASAFFGDAVGISWTVRNIGAIDADTPRSDRVWLSTDDILSTDDTLLAVETYPGSLPTGQTVSLSTSAVLPLSAAFQEGTYYLIVEADGLADQTETDDANNSLASQSINLILPPLPDLIVSDVVASPDPTTDGQTVTLSAELENIGLGDSAGGFIVRFDVDGIEIGRQTVDAALVSGAAYSVEQPWQVQAGSHTIRVLVDETDAVYESDELNNGLSIELADVPAADLTVVELTWNPQVITDSDTVTFTARVANAGAGTLRDVAVRFEVNGVFLETSSVSGGLAAGADTTVEASWAARPGDYTVTAIVDSGGEISESNEDNNSTSAALPTILDGTPPTFLSVAPWHGGKVHAASWLQSTASDNVGVVIYRFEVSQDGSNWTLIGESASGGMAWDTTGLADGDTMVRFTAADAAGNTAVQTETYVVDNTAPSPVQLSAEPAEFSVVLNWSESGATDFGYYLIYRSLSADSGFARINGAMITETFTDRTVSPGVTYWYKVTVVDHVLNESGFSNAASAVPDDDSTPPDITRLLPMDSARAPDMLHLDVSATDNVAVTRIVFEYSSDGDTWLEMASGAASTLDWDVSGIDDGDYLVRVTAADALDNETSIIQSYTIDHTGPESPSAPRVTPGEVLLVVAWDPAPTTGS